MTQDQHIGTDLTAIVSEPAITLDNDTQLDQRQSVACRLSATTDWTHEQIAETAGYSSASACSTFLRSDRGKMGVQIALRQHMQDAGRIGLQQAIWTVRNAKSERLKWEAAVDLMDRARIQEPEPESDSGRTAKGGVSISINLPGVGQTADTIDVTPEE